MTNDENSIERRVEVMNGKEHTGAETVMPYADSRAKGEQVREMFDNIAPAYDFMNRLMTLGIDKIWRRKAVNMINRHIQSSKTGHGKCSAVAQEVSGNMIADVPHILDVATGTGDLAMQIAHTIHGSKVTGVDLSKEMVEIGKRKIKDAGLTERVSLTTGDCLALPFDDSTFDAISVAFGVRNFEYLADGYREMLRVLRPDGMLCVIELSVPSNPVVLPFYRLYTRHVIPLAGRIASKDMSAYTYLPASIEAVPQRADMTRLIEECGFADARFRSLTMGVCTIYTAIKKKP